jgi:hypothetical protein
MAGRRYEMRIFVNGVPIRMQGGRRNEKPDKSGLFVGLPWLLAIILYLIGIFFGSYIPDSIEAVIGYLFMGCALIPFVYIFLRGCSR